MPGDRQVAVGLDLGTSGLKAVAVDATGRVVGRGAAAYPTARPEADAAEQDPQAWLDAADAALRQIAADVSAERWGAVGLSAMLPTLVALDADGTPVHPAVTWEDARAEAQADALIARFGADRLHAVTGQRIDGRYLLPMAARLRECGIPVARMLGAKDWMVSSLTGVVLTDPSTAAGSAAYRLAAGEWDDDLLAVAGGPAVPRVVPASTAVPLLDAVVRRWGVAAGTPLVVGAADSVLGAYGMGVTEPGTVAVVAGTSTVFLGIAARPDVPEGAAFLVTPDAAGGWAREADLVATGSAFAWLARLLGIATVGELLALADHADLADAPIVLPYVGPGEQGALWDPALVGSAIGLTLRTGPAELALGLLAGIVLESVRCIDALGCDGDLVASGSGASAPYLQRLADATGRTVRAYDDEHDHSALGAALLAGRSALGFPTAAQPEPALRFTPRAGRRAVWQDRFDRHEAARRAVGRGGAGT